MKKNVFICLIVMALSVSRQAEGAENLFARPSGGQNVVGIKLGFANGATFTVRDRKGVAPDSLFHSRAGVTGGLFFDFRLSRTQYLSWSIDINDILVNNDREKLLDLGLTLKRRISPDNALLVLRPAIGAGFAYMADINFLRASSFFTLRGYCEMLIRTEKPHSYLLELGLVGSPSGGNDKNDVRFSPIVYLRAGIVY